jgi:hypothetical protein
MGERERQRRERKNVVPAVEHRRSTDIKRTGGTICVRVCLWPSSSNRNSGVLRRSCVASCGGLGQNRPRSGHPTGRGWRGEDLAATARVWEREAQAGLGLGGREKGPLPFRLHGKEVDPP